MCKFFPIKFFQVVLHLRNKNPRKAMIWVSFTLLCMFIRKNRCAGGSYKCCRAFLAIIWVNFLHNIALYLEKYNKNGGISVW